MKQRADRSLKDKSTLNRYSRTYKILEDLYERSPVLYCIVDTEGIVLDCNEAYVDRLGYARTQALGMAIFDHVTSNNLVAMHEYLEKWRKYGHIGNCEVWLKKKNGDIFPALLSASSLHDEHRTLIGCNIALIDQTDIYKTKRDVEKANEELKLKEQLKNQFIAIASHELRTPIQPLLGYAILAKRGKVSQEAAWEGVLKEARRLQQLANDILDVSRIESESLMYQMDKVAMSSLLESVVDSARGSLTNNVSMELLFDDASKELEVDLDRPRMTQVLSNIIGNAVKFTKSGSIKIECRAVANKNKIEIRVSDTGTGISQEILPNLFGKFVTKSSGDIEGHGGTGLGLFISKAIVNAHKGEIFAYNNATGGATFTIVLPIDQSNIIYD